MFLFLFNSVLLGAGLAMDAFSVSLANGLSEPKMKRRKMCVIAATFGFFQAAMPMIGWVCVRTVVERFRSLEKFIPWIALLLLGYIGVKMILSGVSQDTSEEVRGGKSEVGLLLVQGVATSIDALSVGFAIAGYSLLKAVSSALIIAGVTFLICYCGLVIGKKFGTKLSNSASVLGGVILVVIGFEIFIKGVF